MIINWTCPWMIVHSLNLNTYELSLLTLPLFSSLEKRTYYSTRERIYSVMGVWLRLIYMKFLAQCKHILKEGMMMLLVELLLLHHLVGFRKSIIPINGLGLYYI